MGTILDYLAWRISAASCRQGKEAAAEIQWLKEEEERVRNGKADRRNTE